MTDCIRCGETLEQNDETGWFSCPECGMEVAPEVLNESE